MRSLPALAVLLLAASCVSPPRQPPAQPARVVAPPPPAAPIARPTDWRDWPQTPGDWAYQRTGFGSLARFGSGGGSAFTVECSNDGRVHLERFGAGSGPLTIRTTSVTRAIPATASGDPPAGTSAALAPGDPLLDAIGFSRGRFVVEAPGAEPLVLPAWPEVERVVEDCRG